MPFLFIQIVPRQHFPSPAGSRPCVPPTRLELMFLLVRGKCLFPSPLHPNCPVVASYPHVQLTEVTHPASSQLGKPAAPTLLRWIAPFQEQDIWACPAKKLYTPQAGKWAASVLVGVLDREVTTNGFALFWVCQWMSNTGWCVCQPLNFSV